MLCQVRVNSMSVVQLTCCLILFTFLILSLNRLSNKTNDFKAESNNFLGFVDAQNRRQQVRDLLTPRDFHEVCFGKHCNIWLCFLWCYCLSEILEKANCLCGLTPFLFDKCVVKSSLEELRDDREKQELMLLASLGKKLLSPSMQLCPVLFL